jgi:2-phosphosulfolactate phosphatase
MDVFAQSEFEVRCEWGPEAIHSVAVGCRVAIVVDVLSFTTCVDIATSRGAEILPFVWGPGPAAAAFAREVGALLAGENPRAWSLRPASLEQIDAGVRLVLPSPNGSALTDALARRPERPRILAGCLRNRSAVAAAARRIGGPICVIPAGERWARDGSLRPCVEDLLGAGGIVAALGGDRSPEARIAEASFVAHAGDLERMLARCASGHEKRARNQERDIELAAALDVSATAAELIGGGAYRAGPPRVTA